MLLQSRKVWIGDQFIPAILELENGKIKDICQYESKPVDMDYADMRIVPGFIDIHCHGAYGIDTNEATPEEIKVWADRIPEEGVTAFQPTTLTESEDILLKAVSNVADAIESQKTGAQLLGIHFEGPWLDAKYKGAQPEQFIKKPSIEDFEKYQKAARGHIHYVTLAPEHDDGFALTEYLVEHGVIVSIGHSNATYEEALFAVAHGATSMTHVYNGMTGFHHRENGIVGAAYRIRNVYGEIICDACHSTPAALNNYFTSKGPDYAIMITDSLRAKGLPVGSRVMFGDSEVEIYPDGSAHRVNTKILAGSTLRVNKGLKILVEEAMVPFTTAINSCTANPARCLGIYDKKGSITTGKDADLVVLDKDYSVIQTYCRGIAALENSF